MKACALPFALSALVASSSVALAQDMPGQENEAPAQTVDAPVQAHESETFRAANEALLANNFERAKELFAKLAGSAKNSELRGAATAMVKLVETFQEHRAVISLGKQPKQLTSSPDLDGGRTNFVITTTLASFYSSFALTDIIGVDDFRSITLTVAATTAAGLGLSLYATRDTQMHPAMASAYSFGLTAGVANGLLLAPSLGIDIDGAPGDGDINQNYLLFGLGSMVAGGAAGYLIGRDYPLTEAQVMVTSTAGMTGLATVGLGMVMANPEDLDGKTAALLLAVGFDAGLAGGAYFARDIDWSKSRANYVALSQFIGALGGFTAGATILGTDGDDDDERLYAGLILAGMWGGLAGGTYLTRNMAPDPASKRPNQVSLQLSPLFGSDIQGFALGSRF